MACYCGCATTGNKVKWGFLLAAVVAGLVLYFAGIGAAVSSAQQYLGCMNGYLADGSISQTDYNTYIISKENASKRAYLLGHTDNAFVNKCEDGLQKRTWTVVGLVDGGMLLLLLAIIPAAMMCCCTRKPGNTVDGVPCAFAGRGRHEMVDVTASKVESCNLKDAMVAPPSPNMPGLKAFPEKQPLLECKGE